MIVQDAYGEDVTMVDNRALAPWNATVHAFIAHGASTPVHLAEALSASPVFPLAQAAKGFFLLLLGRRELVASAADALAAARADAAALGVAARERACIDALALYLDGQLERAADRLDLSLRDRPGDALVLKLGQAIRFVLGDGAGMRRSVEAVLPAYTGGHAAAPYVNGCYAFALEETGDYRAAEARGRDAVLRARDDAWGVHAVAHVFDMTARTGEGVRWLSRQPETWAHCNNFRYHVWWHLALFQIERGALEEALRLYDEEVRAERTDDYRDIANAASLLARLEFEGVETGDRWEEMAALCEARVDDGCVVFADLHYMLALGAAGREDAAGALLSRMETAAASRDGSMGEVAAVAGAPAAQGLLAFAQGDYANAHTALTRARPAMQRVGGSHAQRDIFERVTIEASLRAGRLREARGLIEDRARRRGAYDSYAERRLARIGTLTQAKTEAMAAT